MREAMFSERDVERILSESTFTNQEHKDSLRQRLFGEKKQSRLSEEKKAQVISLFDNAEFMKNFVNVTNEDEVMKVFGENNVELSREDAEIINKTLKESADVENRELSEDELELVAGGTKADVYDELMKYFLSIYRI